MGIRDWHAKIIIMNQMDEQAFFSPEEMNSLHCSKLIHTSCRSESSNISLVVLDKEKYPALPWSLAWLRFTLRADLQVLIHRMTLQKSNYSQLYNVDSIVY